MMDKTMTSSTLNDKKHSLAESTAVIDGIGGLYQEPDWLRERRRRAYALYRETPRPDRVSHLWRYTEPAQFEVNGDRTVPTVPAAGTKRVFPPAINASLATEALAAAAYVRDGLVWKTAIDDKLAARGVLVMDLHDASIQQPKLVEPFLGRLIGPEFGKYEAYANAAWTGGLLVYVPRGVTIDRPIHVMTAQPGSGTFRAGRLLVIVESEASLTLIDEYGEGTQEGGDASRTSSLVELFVAPAAHLHCTIVQNWNRGTVSFLTQRAHLDNDATLDTVITSLGAGTAKVDAGAVLAGKGAESNMFGLAIGDQAQHYDHHTVHLHESGHTHSDLHFKVALRDQANSVYTGLIRIEDKAAFCEAYQENRNLVLSPGAKAESIPELEIINNEVRCTHGATVGKIDPQEVFYLQSRGIDRAEAVHLIVAGFVGPILDHLPVVARERLENIVLQRLEGDVAIG